jgi:serine/threonine-protein kinase
VKLSPNLNNVLHKMLETAPSDRFTSAADVLQALQQKSSFHLNTIVQPVAPVSTSAPTPTPSPAAVSAPPSAKPVVQRSQKAPWLLSAPISKQFIAAFLIGVEGMLLWQVSTTVGIALMGTPANLIALAAVMLGVVILRISTILDNKDLFVFVNLISFATVFGIQFSKIIPLFEKLPQWIEILSLCGVGGFGAIALMAAFRLIFQLLYSLL